eukprot:12883346-Prorocentrum_lima.AAC.1
MNKILNAGVKGKGQRIRIPREPFHGQPALCTVAVLAQAARPQASNPGCHVSMRVAWHLRWPAAVAPAWWVLSH